MKIPIYPGDDDYYDDHYFRKSEDFISKKKKQASVGRKLTSLSIGVSVGTGLYAFLYRFTPEGRLQRAQKKINHVYDNPVASQSYADDESDLNTVHEHYACEDLWLVAAHNDLGNILKQARFAKELLNKAKEEANNNEELMRECDAQLVRVEQAIRHLTSALKWVTSHELYDKQLKFSNEKRITKIATYAAIPLGIFYGFKTIDGLKKWMSSPGDEL